MIKKITFFYTLAHYMLIYAEGNPVQLDSFNIETDYTITNNTQEPMNVAWQSGGGPAKDNLTGRVGSFHLASNMSSGNSKTIRTSGRDCLDYVRVKSDSAGTETVGNDICSSPVSIEYQGDTTKNRRLILVHK